MGERVWGTRISLVSLAKFGFDWVRVRRVAQTGRRDVGDHTRPSDSGPKNRLPQYEYALEESLRSLDNQIKDLESMRQRAVQFLAFTGTATAFLVGSGLQATERTGIFLTFAISGSVLAGICILASIFVMAGFHGRSETLVATPQKELEASLERSRLSRTLRPRAQWDFSNNPGVLVQKWIDPEIGAPNKEDFVRALALQYDKMITRNRPRLDRIRVFFVILMSCGFGQIAVWAALVWYSR